LQFQARGSPHVHALIAVLIDGISRGDITSEDVDRIAALKKLVDELLTCCFDDPDDENVKDYGWHPETSDSPKVNIPEIYAEDVRREMFSSAMDFRLDENHKMVSEVTRRKFYQFQLRNQVHFCTHTCWKHKHSGQRGKVCRFHYPVPQESVSALTSTIAHSLDWRNRKQVKILPPRNNAWLNALPKHPLLVFAAQGNIDVQYVSNAIGALEYTTSYIGKPEEPDRKESLSLFVKKLSYVLARKEGNISNRDQFRAAGQSIVASQRVGAVQCCYVLLKLPLVIKSRTVFTVNPLPQGQLNKVLVSDMGRLQSMDDEESAIVKGPNSQLGRRAAYAALCKHQYAEHGSCNISLFQMLSLYRLESFVLSKHSQVPKPGNITVNDLGNKF